MNYTKNSHQTHPIKHTIHSTPLESSGLAQIIDDCSSSSSGPHISPKQTGIQSSRGPKLINQAGRRRTSRHAMPWRNRQTDKQSNILTRKSTDTSHSSHFPCVCAQPLPVREHASRLHATTTTNGSSGQVGSDHKTGTVMGIGWEAEGYAMNR
jgi:hypothetical protein